MLALIVIVLLTLGAMSFFERMFVEHQAARAHIRQTQARNLAESGIEFIRAMAIQDPNTLQQSGGLYSNPALFQGKLVIDDPLAAFRGRFTIIAPQLNPSRILRRHPLRPGKRIRPAESQHVAAGRQLREKTAPKNC